MSLGVAIPVGVCVGVLRLPVCLVSSGQGLAWRPAAVAGWVTGLGGGAAGWGVRRVVLCGGQGSWGAVGAAGVGAWTFVGWQGGVCVRGSALGDVPQADAVSLRLLEGLPQAPEDIRVVLATFLNQDTRSMVEQSKVGITRRAVDGAVVLEYEDMLTGKRSKLSRSQCLCLGRIKIPKVRRFPNVFVPQIHSIGDLEGERVKSTGGPSIGLLRTSTSGHAVVEVTSSRINSPPRCVGNRNSPDNDDDIDVADSRAEGISVNDLEAAGSGGCLVSTEVLMHILAIGESALQSEWNRFCSHKARSRVDNEVPEDLVSAADPESMGSFEVFMDRREVLEERDFEVMPIDVRIRRQEPVVDRVQVERVSRGRVAGLDLIPFIGENIPSELDRSTPMSSFLVPAFQR